jgi:hypothetical protein
MDHNPSHSATMSWLDKGVTVCPCGSASFVAVEFQHSGRGRGDMTENFDLRLRFTGHLMWDYRIYCTNCGIEVTVSPAVAVHAKHPWH